MESNNIINKHKTFNILSIDGGGILGLYSAEILALIEKELLITKHYSLPFQSS